jgi:hypothetical protein
MPLVGLIEICMRAAVQRPVVTMWRKRHDDFPTPVAELTVGPVFWWPEVERWLAATGRLMPEAAWWTHEQVRRPERRSLLDDTRPS